MLVAAGCDIGCSWWPPGLTGTWECGAGFNIAKPGVTIYFCDYTFKGETWVGTCGESPRLTRSRCPPEKPGRAAGPEEAAEILCFTCCLDLFRLCLRKDAECDACIDYCMRHGVDCRGF